ncbi:MAG: MobA/MobL family protein [Verrucomicrobiales bacterium]|nr:MobA/MobL family protein [Verrucomicrobiales bacterium]
MAIYRLEAKIIGRKAKDKTGKAIPGKQVSIVAKAAYRSGDKLKDEKTDKTYNYRSRGQEVAHAEILAPGNAPAWLAAETTREGKRSLRERLWNAIEKAEKRSDSQLAREFIASLPKELSKEQRIELVRNWCQEEFVEKGFVVDFAVHKSKTEKNPHSHILVALRPIEKEGFGKKPDTAGKFNGRGAAGIGAKNDLEAWRESWEKHVNAALESAGRDERVDHRSLKDRGIDRIPEDKKGPAATAMEKKGIPTEAGRRLREVKMLNEVTPHLRDIEQRDGVSQYGMGAGGTWWERSVAAITRAAEQAREKVKGAWEKFLEYREQAKQVTPAKPPVLDR